MLVKWTNEQIDAIYEKNSNILVAAAAGSGKTAVLVERIINKIINENIDIDKLLVVTFTNAAASEMRQRILDAIYKKLEEDPENQHLQKQITLLNKASICTIDSFCLEIVRNNFYELENVSPNFKIADTTQIELLKQEVIDEIFEKKYEQEDSDFIKLINTYTSYKDDTPLKDLVLKIHTYIQSNPFPEKWLKQKIEYFNLKEIEKDFSLSMWGKELLEQIEEELIDHITTLEDIEKKLEQEEELEKFCQTIRDDIEKLTNLKNNLSNWDDAFNIYKNMILTNWPRKKVESQIKEEAKNIRDDIKKKINTSIGKILICNSKEANQDIYDMYQILKKLENLILEFDQEFYKRKREKNIADFNDIEHFALKILIKEQKDSDNENIQKTEVAKRYEKKYNEIAIDEYQDSNLVQEYILTSVSNGKNIFMVGDVKQSIYKFRQAMPELFLSKYNEYKLKSNRNQKEDLKIQLFKNFRSRKNVLDFTNIIFQNIMSSILGDIEYNENEYLNLGADFPENENKTEIDIIDLKNEDITEKIENIEYIENSEDEETEDEERIEDIELEARFVANRIKKLINEKYQIWDRKNGEYRNIEYRDIVVLLRSTSTTAPIFEQEIINLNMPVFSDSSQEYLDSIEIQTIISLLKIIDNPIQDIPLVTVLRSNIGKFTDDELIQIRLSDKYDNFYSCMQKAIVNVDKKLQAKIQNFLNMVETWRKEQEYLALDELIWKIYLDTGYYNYVGLMPNGILRQANLKMLFQRAKQYEQNNFKGLYNFIKFIEKLKLGSGDLGSAKLIGENDNVIRIMSIHKSKGLEFPVVILANTGKQFNLNDIKQNILLHQQMGIGVKYIDYEKQIQYDTLTKASIKEKVFKETLSEEMRILYVALTRAKEKLIITGLSKDYEKDKEKIDTEISKYIKTSGKINPILVKKYKKYLDWIMLVYNYEKESISKIVDLNIYKKDKIIKTFETISNEEVNVIDLLENHEIDKKQLEKINEILNYNYKYKLATTIPTKTSVTKIKQMQIDMDETENTVEFEELIGNNSSKEILLPKPQFTRNEDEKELTSAQKGTLVHLCMQKLQENREYTLDNIKELIDELETKQIITSKEKESINPYKILEFTKSKIWEEMKTAKEVYKEKPFYINLPASSIYNEETDENLLVQGIIDLYYINKENDLVLVDYKTDYVEKGHENELKQKYFKQLELYKNALEQALHKPVKKVYIYSVYLGKDILVEI